MLLEGDGQHKKGGQKMSSFTKDMQSIVARIDFEIGKLDRELASVEEHVVDDLAMMVAKLNCPTDKLPNTAPYKDRLITIRTVSLKRAKQKLTDIRNRLTFALEASAT